jgi:hypothetical protein
MTTGNTRVRRREFLKGAAAGVAAAGAHGVAAVRAAQTANPDAYTSTTTPLRVRRVVTGHRNGRSVVTVDEMFTRTTSARAGHSDALIWTSPVPSDNTDPTDGNTRTGAQASVFRIAKYNPGVAPRNHRTETIDYAVVMSGEIDMELDEGVVTLRQGDVLVQRGTMHNWVNRGTVPCVVAFILIQATPMQVAPPRTS